MFRQHTFAAAALIAGAAVGACRADASVLVFAAASTSGPLEEIGRAFEAGTGHRVTFAFGGSGALARQIAAGAPADVFLSADPGRVDELERLGLVTSSDRARLLSNELVVVVPAETGASLSGPRDLARFARVALADPDAVPAGVYARTWLSRAGVWEAVAPRVVPMLDVRAALGAVASGAVDAAVVYRTDAAANARVRVALIVPRHEGPDIVYVVAPLRSARGALGRLFVTFLQGEDAAAAFTRAGFIVL